MADTENLGELEKLQLRCSTLEEELATTQRALNSVSAALAGLQVCLERMGLFECRDDKLVPLRNFHDE